MRNEEPDDNENVYSSAAARRTHRRKRALVAVAGLAILGAGAVVVAQVAGGGNTETKDAASVVPIATVAEPEATASSAAADEPTPTATSKQLLAPAEAKEAAKRVAAAREAAAKDGVKVQRPLTPKGDVAIAAEAKVVNTGSLSKDRATLRVVSALGDLTGHRELSWVADDGTPVGTARCSNTIRLSGDTKAAKKPNLLVCWRTSEKKSVYTVAVDLDGDPSEQKSVAAINKEWRSLG